MNTPRYFVARWHEDSRYRADQMNEREPELGRFGYVVRSVSLSLA